MLNALTPRGLLAVGVLAGALVVTAPAYLLGTRAGATHERQRQAAAALKVVERGNKALEAAASQRRVDDVVVTQIERMQVDAIRSVPDETPDAPSVLRGCRILRQQGQNVATIPQCARPAN